MLNLLISGQVRKRLHDCSCEGNSVCEPSDSKCCIAALTPDQKDMLYKKCDESIFPVYKLRAAGSNSKFMKNQSISAITVIAPLQ